MRRRGYTVRQVRSGRWQLVVRDPNTGRQVGRGTFDAKSEADLAGASEIEREARLREFGTPEAADHEVISEIIARPAGGRCASLVESSRCSCQVTTPLSPEQRQWLMRVSREYRVCRVIVVEWAVSAGWRCHLCGVTVESTGSACLDHDHATGAPRGVLCRRCNLGLSYIDDRRWLARAIAYVDIEMGK